VARGLAAGRDQKMTARRAVVIVSPEHRAAMAISPLRVSRSSWAVSSSTPQDSQIQDEGGGGSLLMLSSGVWQLKNRATSVSGDHLLTRRPPF
jgi:hypothetical protein